MEKDEAVILFLPIGQEQRTLAPKSIIVEEKRGLFVCFVSVNSNLSLSTIK